jgi:hypothetical protein
LTIAALWLGVMVATAEAQGLVRGAVRDASGEPIVGATVQGECLEFDRSVETTTNQTGHFAILGPHLSTWILTVQAPGFHPIRALARTRIGNRSPAPIVMEIDLMKPATPTTGLLAGVSAEEIRLALDAADALHALGQYDRAIEAYQAILAEVPLLTTVNLQVGHVYREKKEYDKARAAYEEVLKSDPTNEEAKATLNMTNLEGNDQTSARQP